MVTKIENKQRKKSIKNTSKTLFIVLAVIIVLIIVFSGFNLTKNNEKEYLVQSHKNCYSKFLNDKIEVNLITGKIYSFDVVRLSSKEKLQGQKDKCIVNVLTSQEAKTRFARLPEDVKQEIRENLKQYSLNKTIVNRDVVQPKKHHDLLRFVTPNSPGISQLASKLKSVNNIYEEAVEWVWIAEEVLNNAEEMWLLPEEFLTKTPYYPTNPSKQIASDCSEQANALVSLLRASGIPKDKVRVVLGEVDFDGSIGGHAWAQVYHNETWIDLEATSGPYWDEQKNKLVESPGLPLSYYKFFPYPVREIWFYYNDQYYYDFSIKQGNAPSKWLAG